MLKLLKIYASIMNVKAKHFNVRTPIFLRACPVSNSTVVTKINIHPHSGWIFILFYLIFLSRNKRFRCYVHKFCKKLIKIAHVGNIHRLRSFGDAVFSAAEKVARLFYAKIISIGDRRHIFILFKKSAEISLARTAHFCKVTDRNILQIIVFQKNNSFINHLVLLLCITAQNIVVQTIQNLIQFRQNFKFISNRTAEPDIVGIFKHFKIISVFVGCGN